MSIEIIAHKMPIASRGANQQLNGNPVGQAKSPESLISAISSAAKGGAGAEVRPRLESSYLRDFRLGTLARQQHQQDDNPKHQQSGGHPQYQQALLHRRTVVGAALRLEPHDGGLAPAQRGLELVDARVEGCELRPLDAIEIEQRTDAHEQLRDLLLDLVP